MATVSTPADVASLATLVGLRVPGRDLDALARALTAHLAFVDPLLAAELEEASPALTHDPRWRE